MPKRGSEHIDEVDVDVTLAEIEEQSIEELAQLRANAFLEKNKTDSALRSITTASNAKKRMTKAVRVNSRMIQIVAERKKEERKKEEIAEDSARKKIRDTPIELRPPGHTRLGRSYSDRSDHSTNSKDSISSVEPDVFKILILIPVLTLN